MDTIFVNFETYPNTR